MSTAKLGTAQIKVLEAVAGGALARLRDGDVVRVDLEERVVEARVGSAEWDAREPAMPDLAAEHHGMGRELFAAYRATARPADEGAWTFDP